MAWDTALPVVDKFCYLVSTLSSNANIDDDVTAAYPRPVSRSGDSKHLWNDLGISLSTKVDVYKAAILTSLLYGAESLVLYCRHIRKLQQFHVRCFRRIAHVRWQEKKPNTEVLQICGIASIESFLLMAQLRWTGHVVCMMNDTDYPR